MYDITLSCEKIELKQVKDFLKEYCKKWCFQQEKGEKTGYLHWQIRGSLKNKVRMNVMMRYIKDAFGYENVSPDGLSRTSNENKDNDFYCLKEATRVDGPWKDTDEEIFIPLQIEEIEMLRPWQQKVVASLDVWDTRTINIIYDPIGNNGKSILCSWIRVFKLGRILPALNDAKDLMRACYDMPTARAYVIDLPRALDKRRMNEMFSAIEQIKSGYCYDDRYSFKEKIFNCPNIWLCTNVIPDLHLLSSDRWKFWKIEDDVLVRFTPAVVVYNQLTDPDF